MSVQKQSRVISTRNTMYGGAHHSLNGLHGSKAVHRSEYATQLARYAAHLSDPYLRQQPIYPRPELILGEAFIRQQRARRS